MAAVNNFKISLLTEARAKAELERLIATSKHIDIAVAWAGENGIVDALSEAAKKLRHVTIGTHMYQTAPSVLRRFVGQRAVRYMPPDGRLFHPKVYLFDGGASMAAVVGSHNLTSGAFDGNNIETSLLVEGDRNHSAIKALASFAKDAWRGANIIKEDFLFSYEVQYQVNKAKRKELGQFRALKKPRQGKPADSPLQISWASFVRKIKNDQYDSLEKRLAVLNRAASLFDRGTAFATMKRDERRAIAGTYGKKEKGLDGLNWGYFGTMSANGDFTSMASKSPRGLSKALGHVPLDGEVSEKDYRGFAHAFQLAFRGKSHVGGVATASRLLAMKRPDVFVCIDSANREGICEAFGVARTTLDLNNYWNLIVVPLQLCPWWRHSRPRKTLEGRIWDNRAALVDCIYYVEK